MKVTEFYKGNYEAANAWLHKNAPDYVVGVVEEMGWHLIDCSKKLVAINNHTAVIEDALRLQKDIRERPFRTFIKYLIKR